MQQYVQEAPVVVTNEFADLLKDFQSITTDQSRRGLGNLRNFK